MKRLINKIKALTMDEIDLRNEIIRLKKRASVYREENQMLKVKVRKLSSQMFKKDKEIEALLNPKQISNFRKVFSERSVAIISQLREENENLEKQLNEKNSIIKKLQDNLKIAKCYTSSEALNKKNKFNRNSDLRKEKLQLILNLKEKDPVSNCFTPDDQQTLIEMSEPNSAKDESKGETCRIKNSSPESDLDRTELFYPRNNKHEEINYLEDHFLDLLTEVDYLKNTISIIQSEQLKTKHVLENKEDNIEKLVEEIEYLKLIKNPKIQNSRNSVGSAKSHIRSKKEKQEILKKLYGSSIKHKKDFMPKFIIIKEVSSNTENKSTETSEKETSNKQNEEKQSDNKEEDSEAETY
ncbi:unnamed protein product [Brassicogethes aeneus]|uniref:Uncharacterized protein n=1 Tax=Brassicogethes aeneus TaxID=1431903 RepID=A0A9P0B0P5_BRAAE|nr:unnamed protein product [Brassicogethes aeneus]